ELSKAPLIRAGYCGNTVMLVLHHIIVDGESLNVLYKELNELYMGRELKETTQYGEFAATDGYTEDNEKYWLDIFKDEVPSLEMRTDFPRTEIQSFNGAEKYELIDIDIHNRIADKCKKKGITPYVYYMACFSILLSKLSGNEDIVIGTPVSGRTGKFLHTVGMFVNTLALRCKPEGIKKISAFLDEIRESSVSAMENQRYPFGELVRKLNTMTAGRHPLFDTMFTYQREHSADIVFGDSKAVAMPVPLSGAKCDIGMYIVPRDTDVVLLIEYCSDLFEEKTISFLSHAYMRILELCLDDTKLIKDISITDMKLLEIFNDTAADYPKDKCIHELFEEQAEKTPDKTAVVAVDKTLTYMELNEEANRIAHSLIERGIGKGDIVGLMLPRKSYLLSAMLGILKSGAAYLPIDPDYPDDRIEYMLNDSSAKLCITDENINSLIDNINIKKPANSVDSSDLCYCIYTSGSTGKPKGTLLTHRNVVNYVSANSKNVFFGVTGKDCKRILSVTTLGFDIFVTESLLPLVNGLEIILADEGQARIQSKLSDLLSKHPADVIQTTPTKMMSLMSDKSDLSYLRSLRTIILGGEALDSTLVKGLQAVTDADIFNIYGPTEATVWMTTAKINDADNISIGKPLANTQVYIVDKHMKLVPIGVTGELCIAGDGVSAGYLGQPELTAEKFIDNPFGEGKLYRTGDNAYWREDGNIVFVGRSDFQVKIRGLRIELGEIESAIQSVAGIERAVVVVRKDKSERQLICAFYTGQEKAAKELREEIGRSLPKYMLPHIFTHLEEMPLTTSGKTNRNDLPVIDLENISAETEYVPAETEKEIILSQCICDVLAAEKASMLDNFFDIGGDSLKAIELTAKLEAVGYTVPIKSIFACKDIRELADALAKSEIVYDKIEYAKELPATAAQMRVYTAQMMKPDSPHYNIPSAFRTEVLCPERLEAAINMLIDRHESLRTRFENKDGHILQIIEDKAEISLLKLEGDDMSAFNTPFELSKAPLIRAGYCGNTVMLVLHHIIVDGESLNVLYKELNELYMGRE
ncbi:MAG: amino acid adenylation domain-containing protein, partial [Clostridia bacterium]|nr:amino acid adenylation domain-containing protein [Clostridia bacterium]